MASPLVTRVITASALVGVVAAAEALSQTAPIFLALLAAVAWLLALLEFYRLCSAVCGFQAAAGVLVTVAAVLVSHLAPTYLPLGVCIGALGVAAALCLPNAHASDSDEGSSRVVVTSAVVFLAVGVLVFAFGGIGLYRIVFDPQFNGAYSIWLIAVVAATDIGAYAVGSAVGGRKLAPAISPGKTVAGAVGAVICALVIGPLLTGPLGLDWSLIAAITTAFAITVAAQCGDLFESLVKRMAKVKDSGSFLPGHGGVYDRVDGLLLAAAIFPLMIK